MVRKKKKGEDVVVRESVSSWKWDKWQEEVLEYEGNICIRSGRQVGKSVVVAEKAVRFALAHAGSSTLILAASQRQSGLLFAKVRSSLELRGELKKSPTLTKLLLRNGSVIYSLPAGKTGDFVRGYTLDLLIVDEAAYVLERVWTSILPMVAVSFKSRGLGRVILLSTPQGKRGYFYACFGDDGFRKWHVSALDCGRLDKGFLERERRRLTASQFAQEWLGEFVDDYQQFFKTELVRRCMTLKSGKLTNEEFNLIKSHAKVGYEILKDSKKDILQLAAKIALEHHEKYDGTGYPRGIMSSELSLEGIS